MFITYVSFSHIISYILSVAWPRIVLFLFKLQNISKLKYSVWCPPVVLVSLN